MNAERCREISIGRVEKIADALGRGCVRDDTRCRKVLRLLWERIFRAEREMKLEFENKFQS